MSDRTGIEWTDATWNPIRGCSRVSEGCVNCYAEKVAYRFSGEGQPYAGLVRVNAAGERQPQWNGSTKLVESHLLDPLRWQRPRRIFVNSMADLFHESVPDAWLDKIFAVMALAPRHTFQVLTKRPARMLEYLSEAPGRLADVIEASRTDNPRRAVGPLPHLMGGERWFPLTNIWLGVSVEDQKAADERIPLLLQTPAAIRFISAEPLLDALNLKRYLWPMCWHWAASYSSPEAALAAGAYAELKPQGLVWAGSRFLDWVIVGGESGANARPMAANWVQQLRDQCVGSKTPFFFKQWGEWLPGMSDGPLVDGEQVLNCTEQPQRVGKKAAGALLDGREWKEFPKVSA